VLAVDASHAGMRKASWRAARTARRGGLQNAVFVVSSLEALPPPLNDLAALVAVHFPWGSLLRASLGEDIEGAAHVASLVAPGGLLRLLVSASARDAARGAVDIEPQGIVAAYAAFGMVPVTCRVATAADIAEARSSWGRRLLTSSRDRCAWLVELRRPDVAADPSGPARNRAAGSSGNSPHEGRFRSQMAVLSGSGEREPRSPSPLMLAAAR
jgi:hypothetical protein